MAVKKFLQYSRFLSIYAKIEASHGFAAISKTGFIE
jgi:hypothetical protein